MRLRALRTAFRCATAFAVVALGAAAVAPSATARPSTNSQSVSLAPHFGVKPIAPNGLSALAHSAGSGTLTVRSSKSSGVVSPTPQVYLVFWGSQWSSDPAGVAADIQAMFRGLYGSQDTWGTILSQYCEGVARGTADCGTNGVHIVHPAVSPLAGVWFDNAAAAPAKATSTQLGAEAAAAAAHFGNTAQAPNLDAQYVVLSPTGTHPDGFPNTGFCAWHDKTSSAYGTLAYTNLPYIPDLGAGACTTFTDGRLLSGIESTETHEYAETVTDFWPSIGWNGSGGEIGDECENMDAYVTLGTGTFDLQGLWSNRAAACVTQG